ncbi:MAG: hypothetical protein PUE13_07665 [Clostridiales bacterium]|nr:hypothetical protein [Clostridiales bacterium]
MKKKSILSALLSISMLASSFGGLTASAEKTTSGAAPEGLPSTWTKIYGEDFEGYVKDAVGAAEGTTFEINNANGEVVNTDWQYFGTYWNYGSPFDTWFTGWIGKTSDGSNSFIARTTMGGASEIGGRVTGFKLTGLEEIPAENQIEFDLGSTASNKGNASTVFARTNVSADGKSYYEIGYVGDTVSRCSAPLADADGTPYTVTHNKADGTTVTYDYPVWYTKTTTVTPTEGDPVVTTKPSGEHYRFSATDCTLTDETKDNGDGSTTTITYNITSNGDYQARPYFKVVKNGIVTYAKWGRGGYSNQVKGVYNGDWVHVTLKSTADGVEYEVMPSDSFFADGEEKTPLLSGTCADTSLLGTGVPFAFGTGGHDTGVRLDNLAIYSEPMPDWQTWTDTFATDAPAVTSGAVNEDWTIVENTWTNNGKAKIADGWLYASSAGNNIISVKPKNYVAENLSAQNIVETDIAAYAPDGNNDRWAETTSVAMRTAVSADGKSYYEIGESGSGTALVNRKLPNSGADGVPFAVTVNGTIYNYAVDVTKNNADGKKETVVPTADNCTFKDGDGITYTASGDNYTFRPYFAKVVNGTIVYIEWENGENGIFKKLSWDGSYRRWFQYMKSNTHNRPAHLKITTTNTGVKWVLTPADGAQYAWEGSYTDSAPLARAGAPIIALRAGHEGSLALSNFSITYDASVLGELPDYDDGFGSYAADKVVTEDYLYTNGKAVIAEHPSGAEWITSSVYLTNYKPHTAKFANGISVTAMGNSWTNAYLDLGEGIESFDKLEMLVEGRKRINGMSAFISKGENNMIVFGIGRESNSTDGLGSPGNTKPFAAVLSNSTDQTKLNIVQQPDAAFTSSENIKYTVTRLDSKTIEWKAVGQSSGAVTGGIITSDTERAAADQTDTALTTVYNANIENILANARYSMGVFASGDGTSKATIARAWYTPVENYETPLFFDDFSFYKDDEATITENDSEEGVKKVEDGVATIGTYKGHRMASGAAVLGTHAETGAKWITSDIYMGSYGTYHNGQAYINVGSDALQVLGCNFPHISSVNLDMGEDKKFTELHKVKFTMGRPARNAGVRMFVSGSEKFFLEFGFTGAEESRYGKLDPYGGEKPDNMRAPYSPMIRKSVNPGDTNGDSRYTAGEMYASSDVLIYNWDAYANGTQTTGIARENTDTVSENYTTIKTSANSTVNTTGAWTSLDTSITYTVTINKDGTIDWIADGSGTGYSTGTINDEDVKELITANWVYPVAFASGGDGEGTKLYDIAIYGTTENVSYNTMYEKKAYTQSEFAAMYKEADYGRDSQVHALLNLDLSDVVTQTAAADVTVSNTLKTTEKALTGTHYEYGDNYDMFYNEDGTLKSEYLTWAKAQSPISSVRLGGASSSAVNMWNDLNGEVSTYVSFPESKRYDSEGKDKIGTPARGVMKMGLVKTIKAFQANNPNVSFNLCVSPYTTKAEDVGKLVNALIGTDAAAQQLRYEKFGSTAPINLYAIELGNEVDYGKGMYSDIIDWYLDIAGDMITAIKANDPEGKVKIIACGPTAPWGSDSDWGSFNSAKAWVTALIDGTDGHAGIVGGIDSMAFHPYYYGISPEGVLDYYAQSLYNIFVEKGHDDIKLTMTEHAINWEERNNYYSSPYSTGLFGALGNAYFIVKAANCGYADAAYNHATTGTSPMFSRWQYTNGQFHANPVTTVYNELTDAWSDEGIYDTTTTVTTDVKDDYHGAKTSARFSAATVKVSNDTLNLVFVNNEGYTNVSTNIDLAPEFEGYKLTKKTVYTAPNMFSFMFDEQTADLATVDTTEYEEPEVFGDRTGYIIPTKSMVILTLSGNASTILKDEFSYSDTDAVTPEADAKGNYAAKEIVTNSNGTKWLTSTANPGYDFGGRTAGSAKVENRTLVVSNVADAEVSMGANWDITKYKEVPQNINKITFTTTNNGATGGVMLFVKTTTDSKGYPVEKSSFNFSNDLCGYNGTVSWTVEIAGDVLTWTAVGTSGTKTGTMAITDADMTDYDYFAQVYVNAGDIGTVALERIEVSYGAEIPPVETGLIEYVKDTTALKITVDPSKTDKAIKVVVGYYLSNKLVGLANIGSYAANDASETKSVALPVDGQTAKIFVWNSLDGIEPIQGAIPVQ